MMYVSDAGLLKTSGFWMTKRICGTPPLQSRLEQALHKAWDAKYRARTFLLFLMVTRVTPGTGLTPSFAIAFRDFFSLRLCLLRDPGVPSSAQQATTNAQQLGWPGGPSCNKQSYEDEPHQR